MNLLEIVRLPLDGERKPVRGIPMGRNALDWARENASADKVRLIQARPPPNVRADPAAL